jgi:hypothetical protein
LNLELVDINIFNFGVELVVLLCSNANSLLVIALDCRCTVKRKIDASEETHLLFYLRGCERKQE